MQSVEGGPGNELVSPGFNFGGEGDEIALASRRRRTGENDGNTNTASADDERRKLERKRAKHEAPRLSHEPAASYRAACLSVSTFN